MVLGVMTKRIPDPNKSWLENTVEQRFTNVTAAANPDGSLFSCPCCNCLTLNERGGYDICPVCFWEDDGQGDHDAEIVRGGPNYSLSLTQARQNYREFGACDRKNISHVRAPEQNELKLK